MTTEPVDLAQRRLEKNLEAKCRAIGWPAVPLDLFRALIGEVLREHLRELGDRWPDESPPALLSDLEVREYGTEAHVDALVLALLNRKMVDGV